MGGLDIIILIFVCLGMWKGFKSGLIQSVVSLIGWIIAVFFGSRLAIYIAPYLSGVVESQVLQLALGFLLIVLIMMAVIHIIAQLLKTILSTLKLNFLDKLAGGALGAMRNVLIVLAILNLTAPIMVKMPFWQTSVLAPELMPYAPVAQNMVKEAFGEAWEKLSDNAHFQDNSPKQIQKKPQAEQ